MRADRLRSPVCGQVPQARPSSVCGQGRRHLPPRGKAPRPGTLSTAKEPTPHAKIHRAAAQQLAQFFQVPPAHPRAGHPRPQGQIPPQCAGLYVEHFKPAAHDAAANARFLLHVPVRHPELPAVSHLRQHPVQLLQREHEHGHGQCAGQCVTYQKSVRAKFIFPISAWCPAL